VFKVGLGCRRNVVDMLGIQISQASFCHCRVCSSKEVVTSAKILFEGEVD